MDEREAWGQEAGVPDDVRQAVDAGDTGADEPEGDEQPDEQRTPEDEEQRARDEHLVRTGLGATPEEAKPLVDLMAKERQQGRDRYLDATAQNQHLSEDDVGLLKASGATGENARELARLLGSSSDESTRKGVRDLLAKGRRR
jgi:hypothetical protein